MLIKARTYLDANAGSPLKLRAVEAILSLCSGDHLIPNPSSIHAHGRKAKRAVAEARECIASSLGSGVDPEQLVFTSSGTEANQLAVRSVLEGQFRTSQAHWVTTPVEHDSNRQLVDWFKLRGGNVTEIPVDSEGRPNVDAFAAAIRPETVLASILWVNNETGVITDVEAFSRVARERSVLFHVDAAQAWGKLPITLEKLNASYVTFSGHKVGGLAGTGLLWVGRGCPVESVVLGKQEKGRRGGTENTLGMAALGAACKDMDAASVKAWAERVGPVRDRLENEICRRIPGTSLNGGKAMRVANTLNLSFTDVERDGLVIALDLAGYSVSAGSACSSGVLEPSHVLRAMGKTENQAMAAIRISLVDTLSGQEFEGFLHALETTVSRMRSIKR